MLRAIRNKALALLGILALAGAVGCHHSDDPIPPAIDEQDAPDPDKLTLCLNVAFDGQQEATRAGNEPNGYEDPTGNFEKISTLRVIILRDISTDGTSGIIEANRLVMTNDEGRPMYDNLEFKVIANEWKRIYLIANEEYITDNAKVFLDSFKAGSETKNLTALTNWTVSVPGLTSATTEITGYSNGLFKYSPSRRLPQTEYFDVYTKRDDNDPDDTFFAHLFMTRAAAKAMFYLATSDNFATDVTRNTRNTYIQAISLSGVGSTEYVFPHDAVYSPSKESLISVSAEDHNAKKIEAYIEDFTTPDNRELTFIANDLINTEIKKPTNGERSQLTSVPLYFPESILQPGEHYKVGVQLNTGEWLYADLVEDNREDIEEKDKIPHNILSIEKNGVKYDAIARNTYLPIEIKFDGAMDLTVNVLPWDRKDHYVDFSDNVGITDEGCLQILGTPGQAGDYLSLDEFSAQLVLNYGKTVNGTFTIASPKDQPWDAYLITTGGTQDAIQFEIPNPTVANKTITTTHISGKIGEKVDFGIVSTVAPGSEQNSAQLIVMATLETGTQVIVDILKNWEVGNPGILTIIENPI